MPCVYNKPMRQNSKRIRELKYRALLYKAGPSEGNGPGDPLILLLARFFTIAFTRQGFLHTAFFTGLEIKRVPLDFLDDVLLLDFSLEAAQGIFQGFSLLEPDFSQV